MKNVHLLPTDKPSRLVKLKLFGKDKYNLSKEILPIQDEEQYQNIYITSNEEIKVGWHFNNAIGVNKPVFVKSEDIIALKHFYGDKPSHLEKIILTDDKKLIANGVQAIDDEFLEWFVKNPSCEEVEVVDDENITDDGMNIYSIYKIIIPKEELKEVGIDWSGFPKSTQEQVGYVEPKQDEINFISKELDIEKERSYSEEDIINALHSVELQDNKDYSKIFNGMKEWFEQFKNK